MITLVVLLVAGFFVLFLNFNLLSNDFNAAAVELNGDEVVIIDMGNSEKVVARGGGKEVLVGKTTGASKNLSGFSNSVSIVSLLDNSEQVLIHDLDMDASLVKVVNSSVEGNSVKFDLEGSQEIEGTMNFRTRITTTVPTNSDEISFWFTDSVSVSSEEFKNVSYPLQDFKDTINSQGLSVNKGFNVSLVVDKDSGKVFVNE